MIFDLSRNLEQEIVHKYLPFSNGSSFFPIVHQMKWIIAPELWLALRSSYFL